MLTFDDVINGSKQVGRTGVPLAETEENVYLLSAGVQCTTSALEEEPLRMWRINQRFGIHYSFHLQDEHIILWRFGTLYTGQAVGGLSRPTA
jgi:hypothetical protein